MAKYDYRCNQCEEVFEVKKSMMDDSDVFCTQCGELASRSINFAPPISFVGSGFYVNDSKHVEGSIFDAGQSHELS